MDPPLIEAEMLIRNKRYFRQTENTPLAGTEVSDKIGFGVTTNFANEILAVEKIVSRSNIYVSTLIIQDSVIHFLATCLPLLS